jgi:hypothetical protein
LIGGNTQGLYVMRGHDEGSGGSSSERVSASVAPRMNEEAGA